MRIGIIGMGGIGRFHLRCYPQVPEAQVVAVADIRTPELRQDAALGELFEIPAAEVRWFEDYRDLIHSGTVDAVDIGLPTSCHRDAAAAALEAGLPVLCEKPMALTLDECDAMIAASERSGALLMIAQCIRFWPEYQLLWDLVHNGGAGRLLSLQMWRGGPTPGLGHHWMADVQQSGGAILDLHIHDIDYCQYLLGLPQRVYAQGGQSVDAARGYDYVLTNLDYGDGLQVSAASHWADVHMPFIARYEARFEDAFLRFDTGAKPWLAIYRRGAEEPEYPTFSEPDAYVNEIRYFAQRILDGTPAVRCPAQEARNSVALIECAVASIQRDALVETNEFAR